jgi:hypothetical protein
MKNKKKSIKKRLVIKAPKLPKKLVKKTKAPASKGQEPMDADGFPE